MQGLWAGVGHRIAHKLLEKMALGLSEALAFREGRYTLQTLTTHHLQPFLTVVAHPTFDYRHIANIALYINRV